MLFDRTDVAMECLWRCFTDEESESKIELTGEEEITFTLADRKETFKKVDGRWI